MLGESYQRFSFFFKKILNPVDGSKHSINSTKYAIELAIALDAQIILLHCHTRFPIVFAEPHFQEAVNEINKASEELVEPFIKNVKTRSQ